MDNVVSILFSLKNIQNKKGYIENIENIDSLYFVACQEVGGIELQVEHVEQTYDGESSNIQILIESVDALKGVFNILKNPVKIEYCLSNNISGTNMDVSNLSIVEIVEITEHDEVYYNTDTLEVIE